MTAERIRSKETKEIDIIDLIIELLLHWRGIVIAILIGGLLLGGYSIFSSVKANKAAKIAAAAAEEEKAKVLSDQEYYEQEKERTESRITQLESTLTAKDKVGVNLLLTYHEEIEKQENYMENSVLMNADAMNMPTGVVSLRIISDQASLSVLEDTYEGILSSVDMFDYLKDKLGYGSEINELIKLNNLQNTNDNSIYDNSKTKVEIDTGITDGNSNEVALFFNIFALTEEDCKALEDAFIEYVNAKSVEYQKTLGSHEVVIVDASVSTIFNTIVSKSQKENLDFLTSLRNAVISGYDALTDIGKEYYNLLVKQKEMESEIAENIERAEIATVSIPPITVSKRKLLIGFGVGFFVYAMIICIAYIFSHKIKDSDDLNSTFGVNQLGKIYRESKSSKHATRLDRAIYSLKRRGRKKVSFDEASSLVALNTSITASKSGYKKIGLITADKDDALTGKINEALKAEGVEGAILSEPLYNGRDMSALKDVDAAVIIAKSGVSRYDELWDVIEVLDNQKVEILGGIMA